VKEYKKEFSCAVVGNAGILLDQEYGEFIDSHDIIIRSNQALTIGYENCVGSRTDIRILNVHNFSPHSPNSGRNLSLQNDFPAFDNDFVLKVSNEHIIINTAPSLSDDGFKPVFEIMKNNNCKINSFDDFISKSKIENLLDMPGMSCGFMGILLAKHLFNSVSCFGFTFNQDKDGESRHYFEDMKPQTPSSHNFLKEKAIVEFLDSCNFISFYK
jgi:hypothetical protein